MRNVNNLEVILLYIKNDIVIYKIILNEKEVHFNYLFQFSYYNTSYGHKLL